MGIEVKSGKISNIRESTKTSTAGNNSIRTSFSWSFRIGNVPASFGSGEHLNFAEGDEITASGEMGSNFSIYAFRNETTGVSVYPSTSIGFGIFLIIAGLLLAVVLVGFFLILGGVREIQNASKNKQAIEMLNNNTLQQKDNMFE